MKATGGITGARAAAWAGVAVATLWGAWSWALAAPGEGLLQAASYLTAGNLERAKRLFAQEASADRLCAVALTGVGACELLGGQVDEARRAFSDALILSPNFPAAHLGMGTALCQQALYREAMEHFRAALIGGARRPALALAGEAYAACALGMYDVARRQAIAALGTVPDQPVAKHAYAAAALAQGDPGPAAALDGTLTQMGALNPSALMLDSCLLNPTTPYWREHHADDEMRLARLGVPSMARETFVARTETELAPATDFRITAPRRGEVLSGFTEVRVSAAGELHLEYVIVAVNDSFAGVTSARPYRVPLDTTLFPDGICVLRADGYDPHGRVVRTATTAVKIQNGSRTLAPEERAVREAVAELLEELLLPPISPLASLQLAGHGLLSQGRTAEAVTALEAAYCRNAKLPGLRTDLLLAYHALGLRLSAAAPEVHMPHPGAGSVALTFDDGPHPVVTPRILDWLDSEGIKATFFVVGKQALVYPELVREIRRRGHVVGSHSYSHYSLRNLNAQECEQNLVKSRLAIRDACGVTVDLFRPPGGYYDAQVKSAAGALGFTTVLWTCTISSYQGREGKRIAADMAKRCANGGIVLLHNGEDETLDALPHLVRELRSRGLRFVTISSGTAPRPQ